MKKQTNVLFYIPSYLGYMDALVVESIGYILFDCFRWEKQGYKFYLMIGKRMAIHDSRNEAVNWAIRNNMDYILWFDDDMVIDKAAKPLFSTLISHNKDFVAPLFFQRRPPYLPLLFKKNTYLDGVYTTYDNILDYDKGLLKVDGVGFGCCLTKVDIFKKIQTPYFLMGENFGEDLYCCDKLGNAGVEIYCDTTIQVGHIGDPNIAWECTYKNALEPAKLYVEQKKQKDIDFQKQLAGEVDIVMPIYHNLKDTKEAIESIIEHTKGVYFNIIAVVDGKDDDVEQYLKELCSKHDNIKYIVNEKSLGVIKATNQGIKLATKPYICLCNNDIVIPQNMKFWLKKLVAMAKAKNVGAVAPISNYVFGLQNISYNTQIIGNVCQVSFLIPFCALYKKEVIDKIGLFDENFQLDDGTAGDCDLDYSIRISKAGYIQLIARDIYIHHKGSRSMLQVTGSAENYNEINKRTREILIKKWGKKEVDKLLNQLIY